MFSPTLWNQNKFTSTEVFTVNLDEVVAAAKVVVDSESGFVEIIDDDVWTQLKIAEIMKSTESRVDTVVREDVETLEEKEAICRDIVGEIVSKVKISSPSNVSKIQKKPFFKVPLSKKQQKNHSSKITSKLLLDLIKRVEEKQRADGKVFNLKINPREFRVSVSSPDFTVLNDISKNVDSVEKIIFFSFQSLSDIRRFSRVQKSLLQSCKDVMITEQSKTPELRLKCRNVPDPASTTIVRDILEEITGAMLDRSDSSNNDFKDVIVEVTYCSEEVTDMNHIVKENVDEDVANASASA